MSSALAIRLIMKHDDSLGEGHVIFRRFRKDKRTGKVLDAWKYGIKAWPIRLAGRKKET